MLEAVNSGESEVGIIYHYYWYRDQAEAGDVSDNSELYFFGDQDPGAFVSVSGAGMLASERHEPTRPSSSSSSSPARRGSRSSPTATRWSTRSTRRSSSTRPVKPFSELEPPEVNVSDLDGEAVVELMTEVGFL